MDIYIITNKKCFWLKMPMELEYIKNIFSKINEYQTSKIRDGNLEQTIPDININYINQMAQNYKRECEKTRLFFWDFAIEYGVTIFEVIEFFTI